MATATQFFQYWALAFGVLCLALVLLSIFYRFIDSDLGLHSLRKEAVIAVIASAVQGAGFWFSASLFDGQPFRKVVVIPAMIVGLIYHLTHLPDWSGYEFGGIMFFQTAILGIGLCVYRGQFNIAIILLAAFAFGLVIIASVARSL
jgi:hypothetical protein